MTDPNSLKSSNSSAALEARVRDEAAPCSACGLPASAHFWGANYWSDAQRAHGCLKTETGVLREYITALRALRGSE